MKITTKEGFFFRVSRNGMAGNPPLVLVHGAGGDHTHWGSQIRHLKNVDVYALDLPGHGQSDGKSRQDVGDYCEDILSFMDTIKLEKVILAGHSMGGAIAQSFAVNHPERLAGLILVSTGMTLPVNQALLAQMKDPVTTRDAVKLVVKWSFRKDADPNLLQQAEKQLMNTNNMVIYGDYLACSKFDLSVQARKIDLPTLIICGDADKMTPLKFSNQLNETIPYSKLEIVPDAGHMVPLEVSQVVGELMSDFIKNL